MLGLFVVAVSLGASNLAAAVGIGLSGVDYRVRLRVAIAFGAFEVAMPVLGLVIGRGAATSIGSAASKIGGALLVSVGVATAVSATRRSADPAPVPAGRLTRLVLTSLALSVDNLVVGFALGTLDVSFPVAVIVIGTVSVAMALVGLELGSRLSAAFERRSEVIAGLALVLVGVGVGLGLFD
jgi:putative Mn2+ efflux pump MntP